MKQTKNAATRISNAQAQLAAAERDLEKDLAPWQRPLQRHRSVITLTGGFSAGLALALLPPRWWAGVGSALGSTTARIARSALAPVIVGVLLSQLLHGEEAKRKPLSTSATE